jgi:hypothetical protein
MEQPVSLCPVAHMMSPFLLEPVTSRLVVNNLGSHEPARFRTVVRHSVFSGRRELERRELR